MCMAIKGDIARLNVASCGDRTCNLDVGVNGNAIFIYGENSVIALFDSRKLQRRSLTNTGIAHWHRIFVFRPHSCF